MVTCGRGVSRNISGYVSFFGKVDLSGNLLGLPSGLTIGVGYPYCGLIREDTDDDDEYDTCVCTFNTNNLLGRSHVITINKEKIYRGGRNAYLVRYPSLSGITQIGPNTIKGKPFYVLGASIPNYFGLHHYQSIFLFNSQGEEYEEMSLGQSSLSGCVLNRSDEDLFNRLSSSINYKNTNQDFYSLSSEHIISDENADSAILDKKSYLKLNPINIFERYNCDSFMIYEKCYDSSSNKFGYAIVAEPDYHSHPFFNLTFNFEYKDSFYGTKKDKVKYTIVGTVMNGDIKTAVMKNNETGEYTFLKMWGK